MRYLNAASTSSFNCWDSLSCTEPTRRSFGVVREACRLFRVEKILSEAHRRTGIRIAAYCLMPNHWHLSLWPRTDGELSEVTRWITVTHTQRWHAHKNSSGTGPVYQGRFKSFPVQTDEHFISVARYVERNALRAKLVERAEEWRWCLSGYATGCEAQDYLMRSDITIVCPDELPS
jgi:REP element-mobilizing transposase RayT